MTVYNYNYYFENAWSLNRYDRTKLAKKCGLSLETFEAVENYLEHTANFAITILKRHYQNTDALYEDSITSIISKKCFVIAKDRKKLELCGCINGRNLYTF